MVKVKVVYDGIFADITKRHEEDLPLKAGTVSQLLSELNEKYGDKFGETVLDPATGDIRDAVSLLVNGHRLKLDSELREGEEVAFLMPFAGG